MANIINSIISGGGGGKDYKIVLSDTETFKLGDITSSFPTSTSETSLQLAVSQVYNGDANKNYIWIGRTETYYEYTSGTPYASGYPRFTYIGVLRRFGPYWSQSYTSIIGAKQSQDVGFLSKTHYYNTSATAVNYTGMSGSSQIFVGKTSSPPGSYGWYSNPTTSTYSSGIITYPTSPRMFTRCDNTYCNSAIASVLDYNKTIMVYNYVLYELDDNFKDCFTDMVLQYREDFHNYLNS